MAASCAGLIELLRPYRWRVAAMFGALIAATAATLAPAPLVKMAIDDGIIPGDLAKLNLAVAAFVAFSLLLWATSALQTYLVGWVGQRALQDLRIRIFEHLQTLSIGFYSRKQAGVLVSRMTNDVQALDQLVSDGIVTLFQSTLTLVGTIAILLWLDVELALITFLIFPPAARGLGGLPHRLGGRVPPDPREDRLDHLLPAGDALRRPRGALVRAGAAPRRPLRRAQRRQPRGEHEDRLPQRGLLPGRSS